MRGNNLVPIEFEILIELPAKYVRVDEFPAEDTDPDVGRIQRRRLIQIPPPPADAGRARPGRRWVGAAAGRSRRRGAPRGRRTAAPATPPVRPLQRRRQRASRVHRAAAGWRDAARRDAARRGWRTARAAAVRRWIRGAPV